MESQLAQFRSFNRFYTTIIGLLDKNYLDSEFSLTEVRILYELNYCAGGVTAKQLTELLKIDKGYLSRILLQFEKKQLIRKEKSTHDGRSFYLRLTEKGTAVFKPLDKASELQAAAILKTISQADVNDLLQNMEAIKRILSKTNT